MTSPSWMCAMHSLALSILYLRCMFRQLRRLALRLMCAFNSLFEMPEYGFEAQKEIEHSFQFSI